MLTITFAKYRMYEEYAIYVTILHVFACVSNESLCLNGCWDSVRCTVYGVYILCSEKVYCILYIYIKWSVGNESTGYIIYKALMGKYCNPIWYRDNIFYVHVLTPK